MSVQQPVENAIRHRYRNYRLKPALRAGSSVAINTGLCFSNRDESEYHKQSPTRAQPPVNATTPASIRNERILAEQVKTLYESIGSLVLINLVVSSALTAVFWDLVERRWLLAWMAAIVLMLASRVVISVLFRRQFEARKLGRYRAFLIVGSASAGIIWGVGGLIMFVPGELEYQLLILLALLAMGAGSAFSLSIYLPAYFAFVPVMLAPITLYLFYAGDNMHTALACITLVFITAQTLFNIKINKSLSSAMALRFENLDLIDQLQEQKTEAERANRAKSSFLAAASHDLRQPLYALTLFTSALEERVDTVDTRRIAGQITRSAEALQSLFDALLDISKLDASTTEVKKVPFLLQPIFDKLADEFDPLANDKSLTTQWPSEPFAVCSDPILLEQILRNFLSNAISYTDVGGITVTCEPHQSSVKICVTDTGIGIALEDQRVIFQEFYQLGNPDRNRQKGLGLGLSIVERAAKQLGHDIALNSNPNSGSTFSVCVGKTTMARGEVVTVTPTEAEASLDIAPLIAVIDDEESIREGLEELLRLWGCEVVVSANEKDAIARLRSYGRKPDGIICDYRLRENLTGLAAIDSINSAFQSQIPALIVTGDTEMALLIELKASGHQVLHKPVPPSKLRAFLSNLPGQ